MTSQLARRIAFTLGALFVYRLGIHIPVPGVNLAAWTQIFNQQPGGVLAAVSLLSGGAVARLGIFSISVVPYLTAALFVQLATMVSRRLQAIRDQGEHGRQRLERTTRIVTVVLAAFQAWGIAGGLEGVAGVVADPGPLFKLTTVATLTAGVLLLVWLGGVITAHGIGNGLALILFAGIATQPLRDLADIVALSRMGVFSAAATFGFIVLDVAVVAIVVAIERARRRLPVRFVERDVGGRTVAAQDAEITYKLNPAGVLPMSITSLVLTVALIGLSLMVILLDIDRVGPRFEAIVTAISSGTLTHFAVVAALTLFLVFLYTAFVCDPTDAAEKLKTHGGIIVDDGGIAVVAPGEPTAAYLDGVVSRIAVIGAVYVVVVILLPEIVSMAIPVVPFAIGGIPLLILVCVTLDLEAQVRGHLAQPGAA
jgi:preprotein translocase subunit SecY